MTAFYKGCIRKMFNRDYQLLSDWRKPVQTPPVVSLPLKLLFPPKVSRANKIAHLIDGRFLLLNYKTIKLQNYFTIPISLPAW